MTAEISGVAISRLDTHQYIKQRPGFLFLFFNKYKGQDF
ncbi:hypothetical protein CFP56_020166 [Quercus suber]|uniref:Uncharacterized protein n=1 Tax=Quercus suber TaxID=58331 RepID=A0AAW0KFS5_QUESU